MELNRGWSMKSKFLVCLVALVFVASPAGAGLMLSGGTLSSPAATGGLYGAGGWTSGASITWTVTGGFTPTGFEPWHYTYTWTGPSADKDQMSNMIFEVTEPTFTEASLFNFSYTGTTTPLQFEVGDHDVLAGTIYGLKIEAADVGDVGNITVKFDSYHQPMWGDFFAKDGNGTVAYNADFGTDPVDIYAPELGEGDWYVAVPDSSVVPLPASIILGAFALGLAGRKLRKLV
jgi:hypothetical protein